MAKRWTPEEDEFLMTHALAVSPGFLARHDLGRSESAGERRWAFLVKTGAVLDFAEAQSFKASWLASAGHITAEMAHDEYSKCRDLRSKCLDGVFK